MSLIFEIGMLICFGASWPFAVYKTWTTKSSKGKSFVFLWLVFIGYLCGIASRMMAHSYPIIALYAFNCLMVLADIVLCYRFRERPVVTARNAVFDKG